MNGAKAASTSNLDPMVVRITFHVDDGIRGVKTGEEITVQEWQGLWNGSHSGRYKVRERVLVFYHAPSSQGLTSPVSGEAGRFSIKSGNRIHLTIAQQRALLRSARLQTKLTDTQITKGQVRYEQLAQLVRQIAAEE